MKALRAHCESQICTYFMPLASRLRQANVIGVSLGCVCGLRLLTAVQSGDEGVALESCEFWSAFCEAAVSQPETLSPDVLRPFLGRLVPVLLKNMVSTLIEWGIL